MRTPLIALTAATLFAQAGLAQTTRDVVRTDASGAIVDRSTGMALHRSYPESAPAASVLWTFFDPASIVESVALGDGTNESWLAHNLNQKRTSRLTTDGDGTPDFIYDMSVENPQSIGVASARDASLGVVLSHPIGGPVNVYALTDAGAGTPVWTYTFPAGHTSAGKRNAAVTPDGSLVAVAAYDGANTTLVLLNGADGSVIDSTSLAGFTLGVELSADGSRALLTVGAQARLYDVATLTHVHTVTVSGGGGFHRLSSNGKVIAAGGFNIRIEREVNGVWQLAYSGTASNQWFGAMAVSGDGKYAFAGSHDYVQGYLPNFYRMIDVETGTVIATGGYVGAGGFQNTMVQAEANTDGTIFAVASWGDQFVTEPQVRVFDRDLNEIASVTTVGSPFGLDMTRDGRYVLIGAKSVHANTFGSGGTTYLLEVFDASCLADLNGDGEVDSLDFFLYLDWFAAGDPRADINGDGEIDSLDFFAYLDLFAQGCD